MEKINIAASTYLNTLPLIYNIEKQEEVVFHKVSPYEAARGVMEGVYDVGLMPLGSYAQDGRLELVTNYCISSNGEVASVYLASYYPPEEWKVLFLDFASRSSALLSEIYCDITKKRDLQKYRLPALEVVEEISKTPHSVGLLIGDVALQNTENFPYKIDLGEFFSKQFCYPFVYAAWGAFRENISPRMLTILNSLAENGINNRKKIALEWAHQNNISEDICTKYLFENINYQLNDAKIKGANTYLNYLHEMGIVPLNKLRVHKKKNTHCKRSMDSILSDGENGIRLSSEDGIHLFEKAPLEELKIAAHKRRLCIANPKYVTYIIERNINYTNICNVYCRFCAFYRRPGHEEGYVLTRKQIFEKMQVLQLAGGTQVLLQGGVHPDLKISWYEDLFFWMNRTFPEIRLHALSPDEIMYIAEVSNISVYETISRLKSAGLSSLPGAGAEILVDSVRFRIARLKSNSERWLDTMRQAHRAGLKSSATMMFGVQETYNDRIQHLLKLRELQDETGGFTAFICWPYQQNGNKLKKGDTSAEAYLRTQAISRLMLDNINNIQSSWVTMGPEIGQEALFFGANDFGSVMFEENVVSSAGTTFRINAEKIEYHIAKAGFLPARRTPLYQPIVSEELKKIALSV